MNSFMYDISPLKRVVKDKEEECLALNKSDEWVEVGGMWAE